jgi:hypothetical protein
MWGREVGVDEEEGIWMRHKGRGPGGPVFLRRGLPSLMELTGSLQGELALGICGWRELAIGTVEVLFQRWKVGVRGVVYVPEGEAGDRSEM